MAVYENIEMKYIIIGKKRTEPKVAVKNVVRETRGRECKQRAESYGIRWCSDVVGAVGVL